MSEVLVLVDHVDGTVRKSTLELLTIARRLGEPAAVFIGSGVDTAREALAQYGAEKIYLVDSAEVSDYLVAPKAEVLAQLVGSASPAAVLISSSTEGKEIAARLSIKTSSGLITDAVDVQAGPDGVQTTQSVFAGSYTVTATVTKGTPIVVVKPNSATPEAAAGAAAERGRGGERLRGRQGGPDHRPPAPRGDRPARPDRGRDRRLRWPRHGR